MGNDGAISYEMFVRNAFKSAGIEIKSKSDDPAGLANADYVNDNNLDKIKTGTAYAMCIYIYQNNEYNFDDSLAAEVMHDTLTASNVPDVIGLIDKFNKEILRK